LRSESKETRRGTRDALILVDLQQDFLPGGSLAVPGGDEVISVANRLQELFDVVVATRDWHPLEHCSFAPSHPGARPGQSVEIAGRQQLLWPVHCVQGSSGAELAAGLVPLARRREVRKGQRADMDSYSAFYDNDHQQQTDLHALLQRKGVKRVFVMGLATEYCVKFTALDAVGLEYETCLVQDGCRGVDAREEDVRRAIDELREAGVQVVDSDEVASLLEPTCPGAAMDEQGSDQQVLAETRHLRLVRRGGWDYVSRAVGRGVVAIVAVTAQREIVLIEQYRPPVGQVVIELPAGIVGDLASVADESLEEAAQRELIEETGYRAAALRCVLTAASSGGLTDERTTFVLAEDVQRVGPGGGDASEEITVHRVPLADVSRWLRQRAGAGYQIDARVPAGLYLVNTRW